MAGFLVYSFVIFVLNRKETQQLLFWSQYPSDQDQQAQTRTSCAIYKQHTKPTRLLPELQPLSCCPFVKLGFNSLE